MLFVSKIRGKIIRETTDIRLFFQKKKTVKSINTSISAITANALFVISW